MQRIHTFMASPTVRAYVNEREVLVFIKEVLRAKGAERESNDYMPIVIDVREQVRAAFGQNLNVQALDVQTNREADEFTQNLFIYVNTEDRYSQ